MSFWGMSQTGKDAQGKLAEIPNWQWQQAKDWWDTSKAKLPVADYLQNQYIDRLTNAYNEGFGSPEDIRGIGRSIMPGVDEMMANRRARDANVRASASNIPGASAVVDQLNGITDASGRNVTDTADMNRGQINDTSGRMAARGDSTSRQVVGNIGDTYDAAANNSLDTFGNMRKGASGVYGQIGSDIQGTYGDLAGKTGSTFDQTDKLIDRLNPNGSLRGATTARAFAPELAATAARLRRAGVDTGSLEGNTAMQRVENARARAMDDNYADANTQFVGAKSANLRDRLAADTNLAQSRLTASNAAKQAGLNTDLSLGQNSEAAQRGMTLNKGKDFRDELIRGSAEQQAIDRARLGDTIDVNNREAAGTADYLNQRRSDVGAGRQLAIDDMSIQRGLNQDDNATDLTGTQLSQAQYDQGVQQRAREMQAKNAAAAAAGQVGNNVWGQATQASQMGGNYAGAAQRGYDDVYQREAANAGWGTKLLGGLALGAAGMIPGVGPIIQGAGRGLGIGSGGTGGGGGGGWGNIFKTSQTWKNPYGDGFGGGG